MEVGNYVRTKRRTFQPPQIAKITNMERDSGYHNQYYITLDHNLIPTYDFLIYEEDIDKSSPNIIDLIEVGDYVNGHRIEEISINKYDVKVLYYEIPSDYGYEEMLAKQIKSIVTKEQFEGMEYKIGE